MENNILIYKQVSSWDTDDVIRWLNGLHKCLEVHIPQFLVHCICGSDLLKMSHQQLEYLKVTQIGHQELLLEAVELLSALEKGLTHDITLSLASNLSKRTSQLINVLNPPPSRKKSVSSEDSEVNVVLMCIETTAGVMMATKLLLSWLDRNPSNLVEDYEIFRTDILESALNLASILQNDYDPSKILETCRVILKYTAVMMCPQNFDSMKTIKPLRVELQPKEDSGLGFSIQRTRQGNLVVNNVVPESPASKSGKIAVGVEIMQINNQNVVGWEMSKVMETLKASGHEVALVVNAGSSKLSNEEELCDNGNEVQINSHGHSRDQSYDSHSSTYQTSEPLNSTSTNNNSDSKSSSQDTLDDVAEIPASFEGEMDLSKSAVMQSDLHRTSSVPLTDREKAVVLEASTEPGLSSVDGPLSDGKALTRDVGETASLDGLDDGSYEARLQKRTVSDGNVNTATKKEKHIKQNLPPVAYRTQVVGGVIVRIPIKTEDQDKATAHQKRQRGHRRRAARGIKNSTGELEDQALAEGGDESADKCRAVFSDCTEITIGGQTTRQVTVSSNTEIIGGKKASNPALMVPCFQLKDAQKEGFMCKLGGSGLTPKNWRKRWFVLKDKKLYYYKTAFDITALGIVDMVGYSVEVSPESKKKHAFKALRQGARTYYFHTETADEMMSWMENIREATEPDGQHDLTDAPDTIEASDDEL